MRHWIAYLLVMTLLTPQAWSAEDTKDEDADKSDVSAILDSMGYPELQVVPRASERLRMEAKAESGSWFITHWPIQLSALATLYVGFTSANNRKDDLDGNAKDHANTVTTITQAVGAAWLAGSLALGAQRPYTRGDRALKKHTGKDERSTLLRERLAEEALQKPARTMRVLEVLSVITNVGVNSLTLVYADDYGKMVAGVSALLGFLPLVFQDPQITVYDKHIEYKKKIYAPLKSASVHYDPYSKTITPMSQLIWTF